LNLLIERCTEARWDVFNLVFEELQDSGSGIDLSVQVSDGSFTVFWHGWLLVLEWGCSCVSLIDIEGIASFEELSENFNSHVFGVAEVCVDGLNDSGFGVRGSDDLAVELFEGVSMGGATSSFNDSLHEGLEGECITGVIGESLKVGSGLGKCWV
jgi:hypothetical protein